MNHGINLDHQAEDEAVTSIASILATFNRPGKEERQDNLYTSEIYISGNDRCGSTLPPPQNIIPSEGEVGITRFYASVATFHTFFGTPYYE